MATGPTWYVDFFRNDYLSVYGHLFTADRAAKEVAFVQKALQLRPGAQVLDLCCGQGRHAVLLALAGCDVTGLDLNPAYLALTRDAADAAQVKLATVTADMREIPFQNRFDAIVNMYSSFGYLESEGDDTRVLEAAAKACKPGGRLLLDMLNREWAIINYIQNDWHRGEDETLYIERRELDLASSRMRVRFLIVDRDGRRHESTGHDIRLYTLTEATRMLTSAGFDVSAVYGGFEGEPYAINTRRMIIVAARKID